MEKPGRLTVATNAQVRSFRLDLSPALLVPARRDIEPDAPVQVAVDGQSFATLHVAPDSNQSLAFARSSASGIWSQVPAAASSPSPGTPGEGRGEGPAVGGLRKTAGLEGPANHLYETPFAIVYGTSGTADETARNERAAKSLADQYNEAYVAKVAPLSEADCSEAILRDKSLVLIGVAESNRLLAHCAAEGKDWPYVATRSAVGVKASAKTFSPQTHGLYGIYPSPWNPRRYVLVVAGFEQLPWLGLGWRGPFWMPDYAIFRNVVPATNPATTTSSGWANPDADIEQAGNFDESWRP